MPSLKITPPDGIGDSSTSSSPGLEQAGHDVCGRCRLTNGSRTA